MKIYRIKTNPGIVDRDGDVGQIVKLFQKADTTQVHIIYAETGYGKSSFVTKLTKDRFFSDWNIIYVKSQPQTINNDVPEGHYLELIFTAFRDYFNLQGHSKFLFDNYQVGKNKLMKEMFLNQSIELLLSANSWKDLILKGGGIGLKRALKIGDFSMQNIINNISPTARCIKADYIRYLFSKCHILLVVDNIQNIDKTSLSYLIEWINETKDKKQGFILEYTISDIYSTDSLKGFQQELSYTKAEISLCKLEKMSKEYIPGLLEAQFDDHPADIHFITDAVKYYEDHSKGNLRDFIDYVRIYDDHKDDSERTSPTLINLKSLSPEALYIVSILCYHSGCLDKKVFYVIWTGNFSSKNDLEQLFAELISKQIICFETSGDNEVIALTHASILDVYKENLSEFSYIAKDACDRLSYFYEKVYNGSITVVSKEAAWQSLVYLYSIYDPEKIARLLSDFQTNALRNISREITWRYLKKLIDCTQNNIPRYKDIYFQILRICRTASLHEEGYSCITLMESSIDIQTDDELLLFKLVYLSILDRHDVVIREYRNVLPRIEKNSHTWIKLKLLVLNSFIALNDKNACNEIDADMKRIPGFKNYDEYPFYLRLTNIYTKPVQAAKNAKKSIKIFLHNDDNIQAGKSCITYSKLLSSLGKQEKAIEIIMQARSLLENSNQGTTCIYNNLAGYMLLSDKFDDSVWDYLNIAAQHSVTTYDKLSVIINKLAWCYENDAFVRLDLLENQALELINKEPSRLMHCTAYYNLSVAYRKARKVEEADMYYQKAVSLKDMCSCIKARIDGITFKTRHLVHRIKKPYHICYLSFWLFDL